MVCNQCMQRTGNFPNLGGCVSPLQQNIELLTPRQLDDLVREMQVRDQALRSIVNTDSGAQIMAYVGRSNDMLWSALLHITAYIERLPNINPSLLQENLEVSPTIYESEDS